MRSNIIFDRLKGALATPPRLCYADYSMLFELYTGACKIALCEVLYQTQRSVKKMVSYASKSFTKAAQNYFARNLEFLD